MAIQDIVEGIQIVIKGNDLGIENSTVEFR